jgi:hypothetical protein
MANVAAMAARNGGERDLTDRKGDSAGHDADKQRAEDACAAMKRGHAGGKSDEERQRVDGKREDQPTEQADPEQAEDGSDDKHGGSSVTNNVTVAPSTTTTARMKYSKR